MELASAQDQVDSASPNTRVALSGGDYGPLVINQSVTLDCNGASVWGSREAPSIRVRARDVIVENAVLRALETPADGTLPVVLDIDAKAGAHFRNVKLTGAVRGCGAESGPWVIPAKFELGVIGTSEAYFSLELAVPVSCRLTSRVQGVDFDPPALVPGVNVVHVKVADVPRDTILWGIVELSSEQFVRLLPLHGRVAVTAPGIAGATVKLHHLTKDQVAAFNQKLHPSPPPQVVPIVVPPETPPLSTPKEPKGKEAKKVEATEKKRVVETPSRQPAAAAPPIKPPLVAATIPPDICKTPVVTGSSGPPDSKSMPLSSIFSVTETEFPTLVVQPDLQAVPVRGLLFQPPTVSESTVPGASAESAATDTDEKAKNGEDAKPEAAKPDPKASETKSLLSNLFKTDQP